MDNVEYCTLEPESKTVKSIHQIVNQTFL